jgi:hypothetical protein
MTSPEISYRKNVTNELRFLLVTDMTCFNIRFGRYGILKSGFWVDSGQIGTQVFDQIFGPQRGQNLLGFENKIWG